jgi:hypothetical protein
VIVSLDELHTLLTDAGLYHPWFEPTAGGALSVASLFEACGPDNTFSDATVPLADFVDAVYAETAAAEAEAALPPPPPPLSSPPTSSGRTRRLSNMFNNSGGGGESAPMVRAPIDLPTTEQQALGPSHVTPAQHAENSPAERQRLARTDAAQYAENSPAERQRLARTDAAQYAESSPTRSLQLAATDAGQLAVSSPTAAKVSRVVDVVLVRPDASTKWGLKLDLNTLGVAAVVPGSAGDGKLRPGDVLVQLDGTQGGALTEAAIGRTMAAPNTRLALKVRRTAPIADSTAWATEPVQVVVRRGRAEPFGLQLQHLDDGNFEVLSTAATSPATGLLKPGDVVTSINAQPSAKLSWAELASLMKREQRLDLTVLRAPTLDLAAGAGAGSRPTERASNPLSASQGHSPPPPPPLALSKSPLALTAEDLLSALGSSGEAAGVEQPLYALASGSSEQPLYDNVGAGAGPAGHGTGYSSPPPPSRGHGYGSPDSQAYGDTWVAARTPVAAATPMTSDRTGRVREVLTRPKQDRSSRGVDMSGVFGDDTHLGNSDDDVEAEEAVNIGRERARKLASMFEGPPADKKYGGKPRASVKMLATGGVAAGGPSVGRAAAGSQSRASDPAAAVPSLLETDDRYDTPF